MGIRPTHLHLLLLLFPCLESLLDIFDQVEHVHQPRSRPSSMLWASPKGAVEKAKEERIQKWESPKCKVQSAPKMLTYTSFTNVASGFGKTTPSTRPMELERERDMIFESDYVTQTTERGDFSWPSWVEEIDSQVHILPLLTLATILSKGQRSKFKVTCDMHCTWPHSHAPPYHIQEPGNKVVLLYCTFTVEIWKGVAMPWIGSTMASYFRSARKAVKLWDVPSVKAY